MRQFRPSRRKSASWFGDAALVAFLLAQVLDGALTYQGVVTYGLGVEGNPLLTWLMGFVGEGPALAGAKIIAGSCGIALHRRAVHRVVALLTGVYVAVSIVPWTRLLFF